MSIDATARALARIEGTSFSHRCRNGSMKTEVVTFATSDIGWILLPRTTFAVPSVKCAGCPIVGVWISETGDWRAVTEGFIR